MKETKSKINAIKARIEQMNNSHLFNEQEKIKHIKTYNEELESLQKTLKNELN